MKVAMISPFFYPTVGGTEVFVEKISSKLNETGIETDIFTFEPKPRLTCSGSTTGIDETKLKRVSGLKLPPSRVRTHLLNVNVIPKKCLSVLKKYDILHFNNDSDLSFPLFSLPIRKPKILHCHNIGPNFFYYRMNPVSAYLLRNVADRYISASNFGSSLLQQLGISRNKIATVHNAVDLAEFTVSTTSNRAQNLLLFVGRIDPSKGLHCLLRSLRLLSDSVKLVIAGPLSWDSSYNSRILSSIKEVNRMSSHAITYLGPQNHNQLFDLYRKATMLVLPSISETFGIVLLEAMASGTPVVASNAGGIPEIIKDRVNGLLFRSGDFSDLARRVHTLLNDDNLRMRLGLEGRRFVEENFSYDCVVGELTKIYTQMI